jgi:branched-chain amino acid transport system permease protein
MAFFLEVLIGGLLSGVMYGLVALGFVLIYKASGVFNFSQGAMVFFAALNVTGFMERGMPLWVAVACVAVVIVITSYLTERLVLRPLVAQPPIALFMATLGLTFVIEGGAPLILGSRVRALDLGIPDIPLEGLMNATDINVSTFDLVAALIAAMLIVSLTLFFSYTKMGRALRAVADDTTAAMSLGIPLQRVWIVVWSVAGLVAMVVGLLWGSRNGVQYSLIFVALKAFPVLIIGGFSSIPGAFVGGLIVGACEKLFEVYVGRHLGGGTEGWVPYVLALLFLLVRPEGLFGDKTIRRV